MDVIFINSANTTKRMKNYFLDNKDNFTNEFLKGLLDNNLLPHDQANILYKYVSFDIAKRILLSCSIKFSSPVEFEDTMELHLSNIDFTSDKAKITARIKQAYSKKYPDHPETKDHYSYEEMMNAYKYGLEGQRRQSMIFCTSISSSNKSMWSKYADRHRGICLGFFMPTFVKELGMTVMHVQYANTFDSFKIFHDDERVRTYEMMRWIHTKLKKWSFEQEVRCYIPALFEGKEFPKENACLVPLDPVQFKEVIFGSKVTQNQKKEIKNILASKPYKIEKIGTEFQVKGFNELRIRYE